MAARLEDRKNSLRCLLVEISWQNWASNFIYAQRKAKLCSDDVNNVY